MVQRSRIAQAKTVEFVGQGEDQMVIRHRKQICFPRIHPALLVQALTFRAMPVPAGVIRNPLLPAIVALINMTTQPCCAALDQRIKRTQVMGWLPIGL
jgi:hypothetical protein